MKVTSPKITYSSIEPNSTNTLSYYNKAQNSVSIDLIQVSSEHLSSLSKEKKRIKEGINSIEDQNITCRKELEKIYKGETCFFDTKFLATYSEDIKKYNFSQKSGKISNSVKKREDLQKCIEEYVNLQKKLNSDLEKLKSLENCAREIEVKKSILLVHIKIVEDEIENFNNEIEEVKKNMNSILETINTPSVQNSPQQTRCTEHSQNLRIYNNKVKLLKENIEQRKGIIEKHIEEFTTLSCKQSIEKGRLNNVKSNISEVQNRVKEKQSDFEYAAEKFLKAVDSNKKIMFFEKEIEENNKKLKILNNGLQLTSTQIEEQKNILNTYKEQFKNARGKLDELTKILEEEETEALIPKEDKAEKATKSVWKKIFCCF